MAQHHNQGCTRLVLSRYERAPDLGLHVEYVEVIGRHHFPREANRITVSGHRGFERFFRGQCFEDVALPLPVEESQGRGGIALARRWSFPHPHHALRLGKGKWFQQHGIHDTEHGRVGPDAESQQTDGDRSEPRVTRQRSHPVPHVSPKVLYPTDAPLIAVIFLHLLDSSKTTASHAASFFARQPAGNRIELSHLDVGENLTVQFPIETPLANKRQQAAQRESNLHDSASRNRATSAVALSQFATATLSCLAPALVSE